MKLLAIVLSLFISTVIVAQNPVHIQYDCERMMSSGVYTIHIKVKMDNGWHIYSQTQPKQAIAQATKITPISNPLFILSGFTEIGKKEKYEDKIAGILQYHYADSVQFEAVLKIKNPLKGTILKGIILYQACTDERCLQPKTEEFSINMD